MKKVSLKIKLTLLYTIFILVVVGTVIIWKKISFGLCLLYTDGR